MPKRRTGSPISDGQGREVDAVGDVADGPDARHAAAAVGVHGNGAVLIKLHADLGQAETGGIGSAPRGIQGHIGLQNRAVGAVQCKAGVAPRQRLQATPPASVTPRPVKAWARRWRRSVLKPRSGWGRDKPA